MREIFTDVSYGRVGYCRFDYRSVETVQRCENYRLIFVTVGLDTVRRGEFID